MTLADIETVIAESIKTIEGATALIQHGRSDCLTFLDAHRIAGTGNAHGGQHE